MRIAYVCADPGVPVFGRKGGSVHVQEVVRALRRAGAEVELFVTRTGGPAPRDLAAVPVHPLPPVGGGAPAARERRAQAANAGLRRALDTAGPFDLVYERYALWSFAGMSHAAARGIPGLLEVNAPLVDEQARHRVLVDREAAERTARVVFSRAGAVLAVSQGVADWARARSARPERVSVVPNGVDPRRFAAAARGRRPRDGTFTVAFVGTLKPWHGVGTLVDAAALLAGDLPGLRVLVAGDGPERAALERRAAEAGLGGVVVFAGAVDPGEVPALLAEADAAVAPYPDLPGFYFSPLKLYEYLAAALPVVASRVGQVAEVVAHDRTGLLCAPGDPHALRAALAELAADPDRRLRMGRAGRDHVVAHHTWDAVVARILDLARRVRCADPAAAAAAAAGGRVA